MTPEGHTPQCCIQLGICECGVTDRDRGWYLVRYVLVIAAVWCAGIVCLLFGLK